MSAYHISGASGAGKSTVGRELQTRGYRVIETDFEPGLSAWVNTDTNKVATDLPPQPYPKQWVASHRWLWQADRMAELLDSVPDEPVFFCGGENNEKDFFGSFKLKFGLYVDDATMIARLQPREPERWVDGSVELAKQLDWNSRFKDYAALHGIILIDSSVPTEQVADTILGYVKQDQINAQ